MRYELLKPDEYGQVAPVFHQFNENVPVFGTAAIAHDDDKIAGLLCLQPAFHVEPLVVLPDYRGKVDPKKLYDELMKAIPKGTPHYSFVPDGDRRVALIAGSFGLQPKHWSVWQGVS